MRKFGVKPVLGISVPAGGAQRLTGDEHSGPWNGTFGDRPAHGDHEGVVAADVPHGCEPRLQRAQRRTDRDVGVISACPRHRFHDGIAAIELAGDVVMSVNQAGQDSGGFQVNHLRPYRGDEPGFNPGDPIIMDQN